MDKFDTLNGIAAPLPMINVDTDMIIPKQFLRSIKRTGFGPNLFDEMRHTPEGEEIADFVLNKQPYREAVILITGENFGCGSSREHAPWALLDFGIRCVIAPSFADIFYNNCFKNGILPITLDQNNVDILMADAETDDGCIMAINLPDQTITRANGDVITFDLDPFRKKCLLEGLDDIGLTLEHEGAIQAYEDQLQDTAPWLLERTGS